MGLPARGWRIVYAWLRLADQACGGEGGLIGVLWVWLGARCLVRWPGLVWAVRGWSGLSGGGLRVGRRVRNGPAWAHGEAVGTACRLRCDAREPGPRQNSLRASRCAQTTAASQITKQACPPAGLRPGPLRFSPPRKSPTPGHSSRADTGRSIGRHEGCGLPVALRGHGQSESCRAATMLERALLFRATQGFDKLSPNGWGR